MAGGKSGNEDFMLIPVHKLEKGLWVCKLSDLDLFSPLAKRAPHGIEHEFGQRPLPVVLVDVGRFQHNLLSSLVSGDMGT